MSSEPPSTPGPTPGTLQGRPLLDSRADMRLYLERPDVEHQVEDAVRRGLNVLLVGARGSGRTSLCRALLFRSRSTSPHGPDGTPGPPRRPGWRYVRAASADDVAGALRLLLDCAGTRPEELPPPGTAPLQLVAALRDRVAALGQTPTFVVDDLDATIGNQLFGVLRDEVWTVGAQWVVTVPDDASGTLLRPPADAFFDVRVTVPPLTAPEASELLRRRLGHGVELPAEAGPWTPRQVLDLARAAPQDWGAEALVRARRDAEVAALGRPAEVVAAALEALGPVSPSDRRLLLRTGWTSSRASQVLRRLLEAGLVTYREVKGAGPGRPARLYELVPPGLSDANGMMQT